VTKSASSSTKFTIILAVLGLFITLLIGAFVALFGNAVGENYGIILALPAALVIGFLFFFDRYMLFFLIILSRASLDVLLDVTKFGSFGLGAVLNALIILMAFIAVFERPYPARKIFRQTWLLFLMVAFFSIFLSPDLLTAIKTFLVLLSYASMFVLAIVLIKSERDYERWMRAIFLSSIIPVMYAFLDIVNGGFHSQESEGFRISSTFSHPNVFAFYLVLMISLSFYFYKIKALYIPKFIRSTLPIYILLMLALLVLTKTRSAWASCFAFFALYALLYERKYLLYILLAPVVAFMIPEVRDRFLDLAQGNEVINYSKLNSLAWRKMLWQSGLDYMSVSHYFLGYGLEAFRYYSADFFALSGGRPLAAHSVYVELFFETGFAGLSGFIWLHFRVGQLLATYYKQNKLMIFTSIMFLLEFMLEAYSDNMLTYLSFNWYLWFILGAAYAVNYAKLQQDDENKTVTTTPVAKAS
jgi:hypothetical protein